jgi:RNA polymerase sigma-70 factor (ECF subfamily)
MRVARRILRSEEEARDAVQSAYLAAFEHFRGFRAESGFHTWITRIVKNECLMYVRRWERRRICSDLDAEPARSAVIALANRTPTPEDIASHRELAAAIAAAARRLPRGLKEVYRLCCVSGRSVREAADTLGLTASATKTRLFRAQHRIQSELETQLIMRPPQNTAAGMIPTTTETARTQIAA